MHYLGRCSWIWLGIFIHPSYIFYNNSSANSSRSWLLHAERSGLKATLFNWVDNYTILSCFYCKIYIYRRFVFIFNLDKDAFFNNVGTILTYAVIGTLFNAFATGVSIWAVNKEIAILIILLVYNIKNKLYSIIVM